MSITLAAQDLCLTQSAVSRQILALEQHLGVRLLVRGYRSIGFTPEGERLFRSADAATQQLQDVLGELKLKAAIKPVVLSATVGVTGLWLLPRLSRFQQLHPAIDLRVSSNNLVTDLRHDGIDLAIRYTSRTLAPAGSTRLFGHAIAPVAHPSLGLQSLRSAQALSKLCLLEFDDPKYPWLHWADWLGSMGWAAATHQGMLHFNQYDQVIQAALDGRGVALGRLELIQPLLDQQRLVLLAPPQPRTDTEQAYWLVRANEQPRDDVRHVAEWIEAEARSAPDVAAA